MKISLGSKYRDSVSGWEGTATARYTPSMAVVSVCEMALVALGIAYCAGAIR